MKIKLSIESHRLKTSQKNIILQDYERNELIQLILISVARFARKNETFHLICKHCAVGCLITKLFLP